MCLWPPLMTVTRRIRRLIPQAISLTTDTSTRNLGKMLMVSYNPTNSHFAKPFSLELPQASLSVQWPCGSRHAIYIAANNLNMTTTTRTCPTDTERSSPRSKPRSQYSSSLQVCPPKQTTQSPPFPPILTSFFLHRPRIRLPGPRQGAQPRPNPRAPLPRHRRSRYVTHHQRRSPPSPQP